MMMTQEQPPAAAEPGCKTRGPRALLAAVTGAVVLAALLVAVAAWTTQPSPMFAPTRVLVDGSRGRGEVVATIEADYQEPDSWHDMQIDGGSCEIATACAAGASCPVLRAAVLKPRPLGEGRVAIDAVVTELWPTRARQALQDDGALDCKFHVTVDVLKTGWRIEREVGWSLRNTGSQTTVSVTPQKVLPKVQNGTLVVNASYMLQADLAQGSALGDLLRSVPVLVRAEFGYVEQQEGGLHAGLHVDAELSVTTEAGTGRTVVALPFATVSSASLKTLGKYMAAVGKSAPEPPTADGDVAGVRLHNLVFAAAPHAPATASLFGGSHEVAWSRNFSFTTRRERRLSSLPPGLMSLLPQDVSLLHRFQVDDQVLEVLVVLSGAEPAEAMLRVRSGGSFTGTFEDVLSASIRMDQLMEPSVSMGSGSGSGSDMTTPIGNITTSVTGSTELMTWKGDGMSATMTRTGEDFTLDLKLPDNMVGSLAMKAGDLTGSLKSGTMDIATLTGTLVTEDGGNNQKLDAIATVGPPLFEAPTALILHMDIKPAESVGGSIVGDLKFENGTALGGADLMLEVLASGSAKGHVKVMQGSAPVVDAALTLDVLENEQKGGRIQASASVMGEQLFSVDAGCKSVPEKFEAHTLVKMNASGPALVDMKIDFVPDSVFGGNLKAHLDVEGGRIVKADMLASEAGTLRTVDASLSLADDPNVQRVKLQFSKPGLEAVTIDGSYFMGQIEFVKAAIAGTAIDTVITVQDMGARRELVVAKPGAWNADVSIFDEKKSALGDPLKVSVSLAQEASVVTLKVDTPEMIKATVAADSSNAASLVLSSTLSMFADTAFQPVGTFGGTMTHDGDMSSGKLTLSAGELSQAVDLTVSRGFLLQPDSTYKMSMSAKAKIPDADMDIQIDDLYVKTYADMGMAGVGWGMKMMDSKGATALVQGVDLGMAPPMVDPAKAVVVKGSMTVEVQGDVAAFVADPAVKKGFQVAIAESVGVPRNSVKVMLAVTRRLSEMRRLAGAVKVDYEILVPETADYSEVSAVLTSAKPADLTTKVVAAIKEESGGSSPHALTITEVAAPTVTEGGQEVSRAGGVGGALPVALLAAAVGMALSA